MAMTHQIYCYDVSDIVVWNLSLHISLRQPTTNLARDLKRLLAVVQGFI